MPWGEELDRFRFTGASKSKLMRGYGYGTCSESGRGYKDGNDGHGDGAGRGEGFTDMAGTGIGTIGSRLILEFHMIKKLKDRNELPLILVDSLEFEESKCLLESMLKEASNKQSGGLL